VLNGDGPDQAVKVVFEAFHARIRGVDVFCDRGCQFIHRFVGPDLGFDESLEKCFQFRVHDLY